MERDSFLYKLRRRLQVVAYYLIPHESLSKLYFWIVLRKKLNLDDPQSFNEKIQWMKLYYYPNNPLVINGTDKYSVRDYIKKKGFGDKLVPLLGVWESVEDIDWDQLPNSFVLKCNHGCAYNIVVSDKSQLNVIAASKRLRSWIKEDFGTFNVELHYSEIKPHLITCEKYLGNSVIDYKFFCFNGVPYCIYVSKDLIHDRQAQIGFFYLDGNKMPLHRDDYTDLPTVTLPPFFDEMRDAATIISKDFPFVRVDFFIANETWYFAELTFTPGAGMMPFNPECYDLEWGKMIDLQKLNKGDM